MKTNIAVNSTRLVLLTKVDQLFKFEVYADSSADAIFLTDSRRDMHKFLSNEESVISLAKSEYVEHKENHYNESEFQDYLWEHVERFAQEAGLTIRTGAKS